MRSPLPLQRYPLARTSSVDEAAHIQRAVSAPVKVEKLDPRVSFSWEANGIQQGRLSIVTSRYRASISAHSQGVTQRFALAVPSYGGGSAAQGAHSAQLVPGRTAALCSPTTPTQFVLGTGYEGRTVAFPADLAESALDALTGVHRTDPLRFELALDTRNSGVAAALRLLEFMIGEADQAVSAIRSPLLESQLSEGLVCALLSGAEHNHSHLFATTPKTHEPVCVRRTAEYIAAHAHQHVGLADLAAAAGVPVRTLTAAFRAHRGQSPIAFLRARRFELARQRLASPTATTVAEVALSCGFEHLGRFSVGYRIRFGEHASETLRRGKRGAELRPRR